MQIRIYFIISLALFNFDINAEKISKLDSTITKTESSVLATENWLKDATTIPFGNPEKRIRLRNTFNGVRLLFEPQFGHVFQTVSNRIEINDYNGLIKFGGETNLLKGYVSLQALIIFPTTVQLDTLSMIRNNQHIIDQTGRVSVDYGFALGFSFFDGIIAIGYGGLFFDKRDFINMRDIPKTTFNYQSNFVYFAIQPVSAIKTVIQNIKSLK